MTMPGRKLTSATLRRIDEQARAKVTTYTDLARDYGVSKYKLLRMLKAERDAGRLPQSEGGRR